MGMGGICPNIQDPHTTNDPMKNTINRKQLPFKRVKTRLHVSQKMLCQRFEMIQSTEGLSHHNSSDQLQTLHWEIMIAQTSLNQSTPLRSQNGTINNIQESTILGVFSIAMNNPLRTKIANLSISKLIY